MGSHGHVEFSFLSVADNHQQVDITVFTRLSSRA
jgi:hypothetical protein